MTLRMTHLFALVFSIFMIGLGGIHGRTLAQRPTLSLMTQDGQTYDCVDFYKQPAFDHPLLKHHIPKVRSNSTSSSFQGKFNGNGTGGCPDGKVPVWHHSTTGEPPHIPLDAPVHCYATVRTILDNTNKKFYGSNALSNLYKPDVVGHQWSSARIKLMNGPDSIEAGWMVFPDYFKDNEAHLYARFTAGSKGCMNLDCPGFVQVAHDTPLGSSPQAYSNIAGTQVMWNIFMNKHSDDGNWWLSLTWDSIGTREIGYWPGSLFTGLKDFAAQVEWGGEINNPGSISPAPSMGNSLKATYDPSMSAFFEHITVVDQSSNNVVPQGTEKFNDCSNFYTVLDWGDRGGDIGRIIFYGGSQPELSR